MIIFQFAKIRQKIGTDKENLQIKRRGVFKKGRGCLWKRKISVYLQLKTIWGISSSLARALDWQSKGDEFESRMLHLCKKH